MKYLSSLPNMRRSAAFSFERSAIFSALSRSLWKLLWIFLMSSLLVENWTWMSVGRYSYKNRRDKSLLWLWYLKSRTFNREEGWFFFLSMWQTFAWVASLLVMNSSPIFLWASRIFVCTSCLDSKGRGWVRDKAPPGQDVFHWQVIVIMLIVQ